MLIKKLIRIIVVLLILIGICGGFWYHSSTIAPTKYVMQSVNVQDELIPNAFEGFKIGFISDFDLQTSKDLSNLENEEKEKLIQYVQNMRLELDISSSIIINNLFNGIF